MNSFAVVYVDGKKVGRGRVERTLAYTLSLGESADVGVELGSPVAEGFHDGDSRFTGRVKWVQLDKGGEGEGQGPAGGGR